MTLPTSSTRKVNGPLWALAAALLALTFLWTYWPTIVELVRTWNRDPDYSHGFLVVPIALYILWARRGSFPGVANHLAWAGLLLIALGGVVHYGAGLLYFETQDAWSILLWLAGVVWLFCGWRVLGWCSPAIAFLAFMVPLPWRMETVLSHPLRRIATEISCWVLQGLGQPALAEGNTILINDMQLEVADACSGLRIFVGTLALAFAFVMLVRRVWWQKLVLVASVVPIAILANVCRVVSTGLLYQYVSSAGAKAFVHDVSGWAMIPLAAGLFALVLWYVDRLFHEIQPLDVTAVIQYKQG
jgi:exosortase